MNTVLLILGMGGWEILLILFVTLVLFGGKEIPAMARSIGKAIREFRQITDNIKKDLDIR
ncbi:MAG: Sec-independent protein translocase subunit TatA/TatB [Candidatus Cyclobacteriaceae bacterium M3_2C_046]